MINLRNTIVICTVLGLSTVAFGENNVSKNLASNGQAVMAATASVTAPQMKIQHHNSKAIAFKIDVVAVNGATQEQLVKTVKAKAAKKIIAARLAVGGKFTDQTQLCKNAKLTKAQMKKLAAAFPVKN